ncbi:MAG TPA: outer membrane beta-barrel protein [Gemmatimonadota bacterium]|nr:outer membrane beta-barrel protein [Gemmatimonadota bacterium]
MRRFACAILLATGLTLHTGDRVSAQVYVEPFAGVLIVEDGGLEHLGFSIDPSAYVGGALGYTLRPGWEIAAAYGWAPAILTDDETGAEEDLFIHAYYAAVNYVRALSDPWSFVASVGAGGMTIQDDTVADDSSDPMVTLGGGLRYRASERFSIQGIVRDHIQLCKGLEGDEFAVSICPDDDSPRHHVEISGGVLILF